MQLCQCFLYIQSFWTILTALCQILMQLQRSAHPQTLVGILQLRLPCTGFKAWCFRIIIVLYIWDWRAGSTGATGLTGVRLDLNTLIPCRHPL